ncbi:hypothetical protein HELRODRAFT_188102 [Helobdella robusta]|uniref:WSC domain-containing protein n=1 Tax=Helobdella robusta TaxID=6412 RepID=T1FPM9_HELRO|nr:hypothetical protein HELRODRAFT_188102 [Helobdella robusta]ESO13080.1 hypothetical protein HELRODRAFT_188102 [Helobdella robusta]
MKTIGIILLLILLEKTSAIFVPVFSSFGLRTCTLGAADLEYIYSYDSHIKCVTACSAVVSCVGCSYHRDTKTCQLFKARSKMAITHDIKDLCVYFEKSGSQMKHDELTGQFIGCYGDGIPRDLNGFSMHSGVLTPSLCWKICITAGNTFFGVQNYYECYCGNSYGLYGPTPGTCTSKCTGDSAEICGGYSKNSVYSAQANGKTFTWLITENAATSKHVKVFDAITSKWSRLKNLLASQMNINWKKKSREELVSWLQALSPLK